MSASGLVRQKLDYLYKMLIEFFKGLITEPATTNNVTWYDYVYYRLHSWLAKFTKGSWAIVFLSISNTLLVIVFLYIISTLITGEYPRTPFHGYHGLLGGLLFPFVWFFIGKRFRKRILPLQKRWRGESIHNQLFKDILVIIFLSTPIFLIYWVGTPEFHLFFDGIKE